jgi:hypothetical protein
MSAFHKCVEQRTQRMYPGLPVSVSVSSVSGTSEFLIIIFAVVANNTLLSSPDLVGCGSIHAHPAYRILSEKEMITFDRGNDIRLDEVEAMSKNLDALPQGSVECETFIAERRTATKNKYEVR